MKKMLKKINKSVFKHKLITPVLEFKPINIVRYVNFISDYINFKKLKKSKAMSIKFMPMLEDKTKYSQIDPHYFYQGIWAMEKIVKEKPAEHTDIGSEVNWVALLSRVIKTKFVDIRPIPADVVNLENIKGSILALPFQNNSINSLSCLHVAEHIGLGRYGDKIDPEGTHKACKELSRVLSIDGSLYFSLPIGKEKVYFNAHRVHDPETIIEYFGNLKLKEFSVIDDRGKFIRNVEPSKFKGLNYGCGLFHFTK